METNYLAILLLSNAVVRLNEKYNMLENVYNNGADIKEVTKASILVVDQLKAIRELSQLAIKEVKERYDAYYRLTDV